LLVNECIFSPSDLVSLPTQSPYSILLDDNDVLAEQLIDLNIILRLTEIKGLLERQEHVYKEKKRAKELRNRAISEYLVLGFVWVMGAFTMLIWLKF
jgi:hypothetical protein